MLDRVLIERLVLVGVWLAAGTLGVFFWQWGGGAGDLDVARTAAVTTLVLFQKVHVFNCRSEDTSVFHTALLANNVLFIGVLSSLTLHVAAIYLPLTQRVLRFAPIDPTTRAVAAVVAATAIVVNEPHKRLRPPPPCSARHMSAPGPRRRGHREDNEVVARRWRPPTVSGTGGYW